MNKYLESIGKNSCKAFTCKIRNQTKNKVLIKFVNLIKKNRTKIIKQNKKDINFEKKRNLKQNSIDRLQLHDNIINAIIKSIKNIIKKKLANIYHIRVEYPEI